MFVGGEVAVGEVRRLIIIHKYVLGLPFNSTIMK